MTCSDIRFHVQVTAQCKSLGVAMPGRVQTLGLARVPSDDTTAAAGETQTVVLLDSDGHSAGEVWHENLTSLSSLFACNLTVGSGLLCNSVQSAQR